MCHDRGRRRAWMGWKWVSHPILRFKRTEVEKGIPVNGLFKPWSTRERLRTSFKIRNLEAWLRCGVLCFGLKWQRQANKGKMLLGQVRESEIPHLDLSGASKFPTEHKHLHGSEWNPLSQWMIHKMLQGNSVQSRSGFRDKDKARDFMGSYCWDEVCHGSLISLSSSSEITKHSQKLVCTNPFLSRTKDTFIFNHVRSHVWW